MRVGPVAFALLVLAGAPGGAVGQEGCLEGSRAVEMTMLLEKTIFQVDVLTLTVRIGGEEAAGLRRITSVGDRSDEVEDRVVRIAAGSTCADAGLEFRRDVSLERFLEAVRKSSRAARDAELIPVATYRLIDESLPEWYAFLDGRGVREGDRMSYRIRGDTLGIRYRASDGEELLDRTDVSAARRRSVLAGYFAPGSDFRDGLLRSLFRIGGGPAPEGEPSGRAGEG